MIYRTSVGLDVHARSIAAAALDHMTGEVAQRSFAYDPAAVAEWALSLGCRYCYANRDHVKALDNYLHAHDPESPLLLGHLHDDDEVSQAPQRSLLAQGSQLSLGI